MRNRPVPLGLLVAIGACALAGCHRYEPQTAGAAEAPRALPGRIEPTTGATTRSLTLAPQPEVYGPLSDAVMTGRIKAALLADPALAGADVSVNTEHGVVSLTGTVKSQEQMAIASADAQRENGVMRIDNHLSMSPD